MIRSARWEPPSPGFCAIVVAYGLTFAFFAWGLSTPPLDRVWRLHHQLKTGAVYALGRPDRELLIAELGEHEALAEALLPHGQIGIISAQRDGWIDTPEVTIVRTPRATATRRLLLEVQTPLEHIPYHVSLDGPHWQRELSVQARGTLAIDLPAPGPTPELLTLTLTGAGLRADSSSLGVRVTFDPPDTGASSVEADDDDEREEAAE